MSTTGHAVVTIRQRRLTRSLRPARLRARRRTGTGSRPASPRSASLAVAGEGRTVHERERRRVELGQAPNGRRGRRGERGGVEHRLRRRVPAPTMSASEIAGPSPMAVKRSPTNSVAVVSSKMRPASQPCGTCGVSIQRTRLPPRSMTSPSASARGGRSARSFERHHAPRSCRARPAPAAPPAASCSSTRTRPTSTWPNVIQRSVSTGMIRPTASDTDGKSPRDPVWNSSGSSATTRYWLKRMPASGTKVEIRWIPSAISVVVVSMSAPFRSSGASTEGKLVREQAGAGAAAREHADELDRVDLRAARRRCPT